MYKGLVFSVKDKHIIVHGDDGQFIKIRYKNNIKVGQYIAFFEEDILKPFDFKIEKLITAAAVIIISLIVNFSYIDNNSIYAVVSVDINPSLSFQVNEEGKVIKMMALNEDAKSLMNLNIVGINIEKALVKVIDESKKLGYINRENQEILISETSVNESNKNKILNEMILQKLANEKEEIIVYLVETTSKELKKAQQKGISAAMQVLTNELSTVRGYEENELVTKPLNEILEDGGVNTVKLKVFKGNNEVIE